MNEKAKLLIVDDEVSARETLEAMLYQEAYDLAFATNGPDALTFLEDQKPDAILLDVMMPGMDGFEVCRQIKADKTRQHIPIILITALNDKEDVVRGLGAGADEFLPKPVNGLELRARVRSMLRIKRQFDELAATLELREDLSNMIVHDMKVPLTTILGFSELLLRVGDLTDQNAADVKRIYYQAQRLYRFVNDILLMTKSEQDHLILNRSLVDISQLINQIEEDHQLIARARSVELVVNLPSGKLHQVWLDANLFQRVLDNLISNALKFSPDGGKVEIKAEYFEANNGSLLPGKGIRLQVIDQGPGIKPEDREMIFDKFKIIEVKKKNLSQFGLGLAFCKLIVEAHGGRIWVEDNWPTGAVFTIEINGNGYYL